MNIFLYTRNEPGCLTTVSFVCILNSGWINLLTFLFLDCIHINNVEICGCPCEYNQQESLLKTSHTDLTSLRHYFSESR